MPARTLATLIGLVAILCWAALALLTAASGRVPPFQLLAMTFVVGAAIGLLSWLARPDAVRALRQPWPVWLLGIGGLFGYHAVYFAALRNAPPAEASLIAYLWPLLIVLFSAFLPGERLRWYHVAGGFLGFAGVIVLALSRKDAVPDVAAQLYPNRTLGYGLALACAFIWSGYSILSRRFKSVPTDAVVGFCIVTALLAIPAHLMLETTVWPQTTGQWLAILGLGLGPVGAAFYTWDHGVKHGDIRLLGVISYATPVLSTLIMIASGFAEPGWPLVIACLLIVAGAAMAAQDQLRGSAREQPTG